MNRLSWRSAACASALLICEDVWQPEPAARAAEAGAELLLVINASPWYDGQAGRRARRSCCAPGARNRLRHRLRQPGRWPGRGGLRRRVRCWSMATVRSPRARRPSSMPCCGRASTRPRAASAPRAGRWRPTRASTPRIYAALMRGIARLHRQERLPRRAAGAVRRHRFGADAGPGGRCAGRGARHCGDDAHALHLATVARRCA